MAQSRPNFDPASGDDTSAALRKLDLNDVDLDNRLTAAAAAASGALPKSGGTVTGPIAQSGAPNMTGGRMAPSGANSYGSLFLNSGNIFYILGTAQGDVFGGYSALRPFAVDLATGKVTLGHAVDVGDKLNVVNNVQAGGYICRAGYGGVYRSNGYNIDWTGGAASLYIDGSKIGTFAFATSDRRLKKDIRYIDGPDDGDADIEKVLAGRPALWSYRDVGIWSDDGTVHRSFMSDDMQAVDPMLAPGDKDGLNNDGSIMPLNLNTDAIISTLWGALRREIALRRDLEMRVAALEGESQP